jgi:hypothetical protein
MNTETYSRRLQHLPRSWRRTVSVIAAILGFALISLVPGGAQQARVNNIPQNAFDILKNDAKKPPNLTKRRRAEADDMQQVGEQIAWEEIRNLFVPLRSGVEVRRQQETAANVDSSTRFPIITGIVTTKNGENRAILDGASVKAGERLKDFVVTKITRERVTLEGDETYILELRPHQIPAVKIFLVPDSGSGENEIALNPVTSSSGEPTSSDPAAPKPEGKETTSHVKKP